MTTGSNNMYPNLTGEEILKFKETFIHFDPNGSGDENTATINTKDLGILVRSLGFCPTSPLEPFTTTKTRTSTEPTKTYQLTNSVKLS